MKSIRTDPRNHAAEGDERDDTPVCWVRVDGRDLCLTHDDAWKIAWQLIGFCVEHKQARNQSEATVGEKP